MVRNLPANAGDRDVDSIPGLGRSPGEGNGNPLQYSCLGNPMDRRRLVATVHGVSKESDTTYQLNDNLLTYSFPSQEYSLSLASSLGFHNIAVKILARLHSHRGTQLWKNLLLRWPRLSAESVSYACRSKGSAHCWLLPAGCPWLQEATVPRGVPWFAEDSWSSLTHGLPQCGHLLHQAGKESL